MHAKLFSEMYSLSSANSCIVDIEIKHRNLQIGIHEYSYKSSQLWFDIILREFPLAGEGVQPNCILQLITTKVV